MTTSGPHRGIFVGRCAELSILRDRIDASILCGSGAVVLVAGEPGIGKTRLAEEAADYARSKGARVVWGRCWEGAGAPAFWPWMEIVRSLAQRTAENHPSQGSLGEKAADVTYGIPDLDDTLSSLGLSPVSTASDQDRFRFFDRIAGFLNRLAATHPLLLLLDDLHWADQGSLLLLQFLSTGITNAPILVIGAYRDVHHGQQEPISRLLGAVIRPQQHSNVIALAGLQEAEVCALVKSAIGSEPSQRLLGTIMERTEGNPFFLCEVMGILGTGDLRRSDGNEVRATVPLTVREVIGRQLCSLSANCARILDAASVVGREFDVELIANAIGQSAREICQVLDEALSKKIIGHVRFTYYRFRHALVRETIYESLSGTVRAQMHFVIAEALERLGGTHQPSMLSMLAHHFTMSLPYGTAEQALDYTVRAGREAQRRLAYEEAAAYFERALEIGGRRVEFHCDLLLSLGEAQIRAGMWRESRCTFEKAAYEARLISHWDHFARAAIGFKGAVGGAAPMDHSAVALLREALVRLGGFDSELRVRVLSALAHALYFGDTENEMEEHSNNAVRIAGRLGDPALKMCAIESRLASLFRPTGLSERLVVASELVNLCAGTEDNDTAFRGRFSRHICFLEVGEPIEATHELERAAALAEEMKDPRSRWQIVLARSALALASGNFPESAQQTELAREIGERVHDSSPAHYFFVQRFQYERIRGTLQGLEGVIAEAVAQYPGVVGYRVALAAIDAVCGENGRAYSLLAKLAASNFAEIRCDALFLWTLGVLTEASVSCGEPRWWQTLYHLLLPFRDHNVVMTWGVAFDGSVAHFLGILATALGEFDAAAEHFDAALAMNTKMGAEPLVARTQARYADMFLARRRPGDADRARDLLRRAIETMARLGQVGHLARAQEALGRVKEDRKRRVTHMGGQLTSEVHAMAETPRAGAEASESPYLFRREADFWTVAFEGSVLHLRHTRGLALLCVLLQRPETEVHVFDLVSAVNGTPGVPETMNGKGRSRAQKAIARDAGPLIDARARADYRRRLQELRSELAEADRFNDLGRAATLRQETAQLAEVLQHAYGKAGRPRVAASAIERARISVRNNIGYTLNTLQRSDPTLWRHLKAAVRTGTFCSYQPERSIPWAF